MRAWIRNTCIWTKKEKTKVRFAGQGERVIRTMGLSVWRTGVGRGAYLGRSLIQLYSLRDFYQVFGHSRLTFGRKPQAMPQTQPLLLSDLTWTQVQQSQSTDAKLWWKKVQCLLPGMKQEERPAQAPKTSSSSTAFKERLLKATFGVRVAPSDDYDFYRCNNECKEHNSLTFLEEGV